MSEATISLKLKPWTIPNYASIDAPANPRQGGVDLLPSVAVRDLPIEALDSLAEQWRLDLYVKAGKPLPEARK